MRPQRVLGNTHRLVNKHSIYSQLYVGLKPLAHITSVSSNSYLAAHSAFIFSHSNSAVLLRKSSGSLQSGALGTGALGTSAVGTGALGTGALGTGAVGTGALGTALLGLALLETAVLGLAVLGLTL